MRQRNAGRPRARSRIVTAAAVIVAFAIGIGVGIVAAPDNGVAPSGASTPSPSRTGIDLIRYRPTTPRRPFDASLEPFDYAPAPPVEATPIDGYYLRIVQLDEVGGPRLGLPFHCRRCPAYRVDPGVETLLLHRGRYWIEHQMSGFRAYGHYEVDGDRVTLFNDPNCSQMRGEYRWSRRGSSLSFDVVEDPCPFVDERADDLMFSSWTSVRVCRSGIQYWWPALLGCGGGESGVRP